MHYHHHHNHQRRFHAMARGAGWGHRGRGGGRFWGSGDGGMPGQRRLGAEELQLVLLALLETRPAHGYEMIRSLEEQSGGFYSPSPGVIYPALTYLEEIGRTAVTPEGNRKLYSLTEEGRLYLDARRDEASAILEALKRIGGRMEQVREAFAGIDDVDPDSADRLHRARHALKAALMRKRESGPEEQRRIIAILERAAAEIAGGKPQ
jgi:DNA-binding PadR family transcriptional regulator